MNNESTGNIKMMMNYYTPIQNQTQIGPNLLSLITSPTPLAQENSPPMLPYFHEQINEESEQTDTIEIESNSRLDSLTPSYRKLSNNSIGVLSTNISAFPQEIDSHKLLISNLINNSQFSKSGGGMSQDLSKNQRPISNLIANREQRFDERVLQPKHNNQVYSMYNNFMDKSSLATVSDKGISELGNLTRSFDINDKTNTNFKFRAQSINMNTSTLKSFNPSNRDQNEGIYFNNSRKAVEEIQTLKFLDKKRSYNKSN